MNEQAVAPKSFVRIFAIPTSALTLSQIVSAGDLASQYGAGAACISIMIGNLLLWLVAIATISMMQGMSINAVENIKQYLGKKGGTLVALVFFIGFLNWYALQINFSVDLISSWFDGKIERDLLLRIGAALGLVIALLSTGGVELLQKISLVSLPIFVVYHVYALLNGFENVPFTGTWGLSPSIIFAVVFAKFPLIVMFPTLFRYAKSKAHAHFALALFMIFSNFFELSTLWTKTFSVATMALGVLFTICIAKLLCCNLFNIFLASACWEAIVPRFTAAKEYAVIGLFGTVVYTFVQISLPVQIARNLIDGYLACIGAVLLAAYLIRVMVQHRLRPWEKRVSFLSWLVGCLFISLYESKQWNDLSSGILVGVSASLLFLLTILFIEETTWAIRKKMKQVRP